MVAYGLNAKNHCNLNKIVMINTHEAKFEQGSADRHVRLQWQSFIGIFTASNQSNRLALKARAKRATDRLEFSGERKEDAMIFTSELNSSRTALRYDAAHSFPNDCSRDIANKTAWL